MSFRELRNFTEYMRALGYDHVVSMDNFRTPNFTLVADILVWMVDRYDPTVFISHDISTPDIRVQFITTVAQVMWTKAGIKLNTKRLYAADGRAVKELLKVAEVLYRAQRVNEERAPSTSVLDDFDTNATLPKPNDVKEARKLASEITDAGATLFDLLKDEKECSLKRNAAVAFLEAISNNLNSTAEIQFVEKRLNEILTNIKEEVADTERQCNDQESDLKTLEAKIKKKQIDLERNDKRLRSLQSVRPAFMDEYDKLEAELGYHYEMYLERFRNLDYLEHELDRYKSKEWAQRKAAERTRIPDPAPRPALREDEESFLVDDGEFGETQDVVETGVTQGSKESVRDAVRGDKRSRHFSDDEDDIGIHSSDSQSDSGSSDGESSSGSEGSSGSETSASDLSDQGSVQSDEDSQEDDAF